MRNWQTRSEHLLGLLAALHAFIHDFHQSCKIIDDAYWPRMSARKAYDFETCCMYLTLILKPALCPLLPEDALRVIVDDAPVQVIATQAR